MFAEEVTFIGVAGRDDLASMQEWVVTHQVDGFAHIGDVDLEVWREFGITSQPSFAFINDDGAVESRIGAMGLEGLTTRVNELIET